jgi:RNA polymerase sigma factor (sigma-70 family)
MAAGLPSHVPSARRVPSLVRLPPFQSLVDAHADELHRFLVASVGPADAEDCLQETLLSALRAYPRLKDASNLRAWLYTIAHHKATDAVRRHRRHRAEDIDGVDPGKLAEGPHVMADDALWSRVRALPAKQRAAVIHRFVFDQAYREIGLRTGTTEEAARQNVSTGLRRLRMEVDR